MVTVSSHGYKSDSDDTTKTDNNRFKGPDCLEQIKVNFSAFFKIGQPATLNAYCEMPDGRTAYGYAEGEVVQAAQRTAIGREDIIKSLKKLGNTVFSTDDDLITVDIKDGVFYSLKGINELRRGCLEDLSAALKVNPANNEGFSCKKPENAGEARKVSALCNPGMYSILISSLSQVDIIHKLYDDGELAKTCRIYADESLLIGEKESVRTLFDIEIPVFAALSYIRRKGDDIAPVCDLYDAGMVKGFLIRNLEDLAVINVKYPNADIITDYSLYTFNSKASDFLDEYSADHTYPLELSNPECSELTKETNTVSEKVVYGRAPLMITANCIRKTLKSCSHNAGFETIIDRKGIAFPVKCDCLHCMNIIYNSVPLLITDVPHDVTCRIELTDESESASRSILKYYNNGGAEPDIQHTTGWQNRPVM